MPRTTTPQTSPPQTEADVAEDGHARTEKWGSGRPLSDAMRLRIAELAEAGESVRQIAAQLGVNPSTVTRHAQQMGVTFDRSTTQAATEARIADGRARRAELAVRLAELASSELDRLSRPHRAFAFLSGQAPGYHEKVLPQPDPASRLAIVRTAATLLQQHARLSEMVGDESLDHAKSLIGNIASDMRAWADAHAAQEGADRGEA